MKRICKADGCLTILSRFNLGDKCAIHEGRMTKSEIHKAMYLACEYKNNFQPKPSPRPVYRIII